MITLQNVEKRYHFTPVLSNITLNIGPGELIGLFGENGAGKTTLMKSILHFTPIHNGTITLDGEPIGPKNYDRLSFATCEHSFFSHMNALEHKEFYQVQFPKFNETRFHLLLNFFDLPEKKPLRTFSTGQKNQFETILCLSQGADYMLLDEPFSGSDIFNREDFYKVLLGILEPHETIVLSTHLIEEVKHFVSRAILLKKGTVIGDELLENIEEMNHDLTSWIKEKYNHSSKRILDLLQQTEEERR